MYIAGLAGCLSRWQAWSDHELILPMEPGVWFCGVMGLMFRLKCYVRTTCNAIICNDGHCLSDAILVKDEDDAIGCPFGYPVVKQV